MGAIAFKVDANSSSAGIFMAEKRIILWYRNDLRIHDHEPLCKAAKSGAKIIPVYCFDDRQFEKTPFGFAALHNGSWS